MKITGKFSDAILGVFKGGTTKEKIVASVTSPLWFTALVAGGLVEGTFEAIDGATDAIGAIAGSTGTVTFDKVKKLEEIRASLPSGQNIQVRFEENTYKFEAAIEYLKNLENLDQEKAQELALSIAKSLVSSKEEINS